MCSILIWFNFDLTLTWISAMLVFSSCQLTQYTVDLWLPSSGDISETGRSFIELHRTLLLGSVHLTCTSRSHFVHTSPRHFSHRQIEKWHKMLDKNWVKKIAVQCPVATRAKIVRWCRSSRCLAQSCMRVAVSAFGCPLSRKVAHVLYQGQHVSSTTSAYLKT